MLSEIVFASIGTKKDKEARVPGLSGSSLFPCAYRLLQVHEGRNWYSEPSPQQILNLRNGWIQEEDSVKILASAGIKVEDRQGKVWLGKSRIPGHIDGTVTLNGKKRLWEHKAWGTEPFNDFVRWGLRFRPQEYSQVNGYMLGLGLDETNFMVKCKENNDYRDILVKLDLPFIEPIIEWADRIRLEGWVPKPVKSKWCHHCGLSCFETTLDFSWMATVDSDEMVEKWKKGKAFQAMGESMEEEARSYFIGVKDKVTGEWTKKGLIGDRDLLRIGELEIKRIVSHTFTINKQKLLESYGPDSLVKVGEEGLRESFRIREVS